MSFNLDPESLRRRNDAHEAMRGRGNIVTSLGVLLFISAVMILVLWLAGVISGVIALYIVGGLVVALAAILVTGYLIEVTAQLQVLETHYQHLSDRVESLERQIGRTS